ncbi:protein MpABCC3 [Marchantia polymorpha subsp. ruderalis]
MTKRVDGERERQQQEQEHQLVDDDEDDEDEGDDGGGGGGSQLPKRESEQEHEHEREERATNYVGAGYIERLSFRWLNPLLRDGRHGALGASDVPELGPELGAERAHARFESEYEARRGKGGAGCASRALLWTFRRELAVTGALALVKVSVMYVGPLLIAPIVDCVAGRERFRFEGYALVGALLAAKVAEALAGHHHNFQSNKVGMLARAGLVTAVYRKGLRLTAHARQSQGGAGRVANLMTVDVQMVADSLVQLHCVWTLPLQVTAALGILVSVVGVACVAGIGVMLLSIVVNLRIVQSMRGFQRRSMAFKDRRMAAAGEILSNMRVIKMQAWEEHFAGKVAEARDAERRLLAKFMYCFSASIAVLWSAPVAVAVVTFGLRVLLGAPLSPGAVFTALATFRIMQEPLRLFPNALMNLSQAATSLRRLDAFFAGDELEPAPEPVSPRDPSALALEIHGASFQWDPRAPTPTLSGVSLRAPPGSLVAIVGMVGSGKSSMLSAILGEVPKLSGQVRVSGTTAYVAQGAWIQNATIQDNILFGKPLNDARYQETLRACALVEDLRQMTFGDQTEIGERGINLSGGQKQRIQLARAVYQDSDIYLLDDVFSAVDAHTGNELFEKCIKQALGTKTVLLVTHQVEFLRGADMIVVMRDGEIVQSGTYAGLLIPGTEFHALVTAHEESMQTVEGCEDDEDRPDLSSSVSKRSTLSRRKSSTRESGAPAPKQETAKLVEDEKKATGHVSWRLYWLYATKILHGAPFALLLVFQCCWQTASILSDYFIADATSVRNSSSFEPKRFILTYALIGAVCGLFITLRTFLLTFLGLRTAQAFFSSLLETILRATMSFFDTTPTGRIMTRFSVDQSNVDTLICILIGACLANISQTLGILVVMCQVNWQMIIIIVPLFFVFCSYQRYYLATSRELTRMDSVTKAPIIHHFSESIAGFQTIRAFREQDRFCKENVNKVNNNLRMDFHNNAANEWLGLRLEMIGTIVLCLSALLMVMARDYINPDHVGLSLSYGMALNTCLYGVVYQSCQLENRMVAIERIDQYSRIQTEAALIVPENRPAEGWIAHGSISFQHLEVRYRTDTPLVLKGISLEIRGGEKVGVVGRTGSGKSTLIQSLFRLVEPARGRITVDGVDIGTIGLKDLRPKLGIIPQEPSLFQGTVRSNLDPLGEHSDEEIWEALEKCQLAEVLRQKEGKLDSEVMDNGENWSVGQRQLFCLGRALLKRCRVLVLDEATASVDTHTDSIIQKIIRTEFSACTVISIAHRIPSVMDSDKVLVLDKGYVKEFDSPSNLLDQPSSLFGALVREFAARSGKDQGLIILEEAEHCRTLEHQNSRGA